MNRSLCLLSATLVLALLWSQSGYGYGAQKPEGEWDKFWPSFSAAVTKRDRAALRAMMTSQIDTNGGGSFTRERWLKTMTIAQWTALQRSVSTGTKPYPDNRRSSGSSKMRVTSDEQAGAPIFKLGTDGKWRWFAVLGD
jgi:hypothetical protein